MLSNDVLLEIFDFYNEDIDGDFEPFIDRRMEGWITLAHVCRCWRIVVFHSPYRLNLRLLCTPKTSTRDTDIWPPLPLVVHNSDFPGVGSIATVLEHNDRVCRINLGGLFSFELEHVTYLAAMQEPFLELTHLRLGMPTHGGPGRILPDSFLGGTAPRLRSLILEYVPFPGIPKLLLSAPHLVHLHLHDIPRSGHIPPEAMANSLSTLTNLESLHLHFRCPPPRPVLESRRLPPLPPTRSILPSLTKIRFKGASEYLEKILAWIDAPRLNELHLTFFNQIIFDTPQLFQSISRRPTLRAPEKGRITFNSEAVTVGFLSQISDYGALGLEISCSAPEWQLSSLEQVCTSSLPPVSTLEDLYIVEERHRRPRWQDDAENPL